MKGKPGPGDVLLWRGSHDVIGTREPVILVEPTIDPQFWVVAVLDEQGLPTPYTFAVPVGDLVPIEDSVPESTSGGAPRLPRDAATGALRRFAVSVAAAASFALGALSLAAHQPAAPVAEGLLPTPAAQVPNAAALRGSSQELRHQPSGSSQAGPSRTSPAAAGSRAGSGASAPALPSGVAGTSGGGTNNGGPNPSGGGGGGTGTGGGSPGGSVAKPNSSPGNSGSAPGHDSTPGNSGSAPGHN